MESKRQIKILITGGLGNLGSWLSKHFADLGYNVHILSKTNRDLTVKFDYTFIQCDISDLNDCEKKLNNLSFDYIIHAASANDTFIKDYYYQALSVNTLGTRNLLECIKNTAVKNFIYLSTYHVYGINSGIITEESEVSPRHDYAITHFFAEKHIEQFHLNHQLPFTILRLSNSYGCPYDIQTSKWYLVMNDLAKMAFEKQKIVLKTNGNACRDFIWMGDVCNILSSVVENESTFNQSFNVSAESTFKILDIANYVKQAYKEVYSKDLRIETNINDVSVYADDLLISSAKLKKLIPFNAGNRFKEEIIKIFELLEHSASKR